MELSCLPVSLFPQFFSGELSIAEWARLGSTLGLEAIDISILFLKSRNSTYLHDIASKIRENGMRLALVNTYPDLTNPSPVEREIQEANLLGDIMAAAQLGAAMVRITAGQAHPGIPRNQGIRWVLDCFHRVAGRARNFGVKLVYENHSKPGVWQYKDFSHPADVFLEIADGISDTSIGILYDTANALAAGDDPLWLLGKVRNRVTCVHAADTGTKGELNPVLVGTGIVPFRELFRSLRQGGFDGTISIEEASRQGQAGLQQAVRFIRKTWLES
jgi:sugar phosphate isomerase/epimerase